jgi:hypothetical protein
MKSLFQKLARYPGLQQTHVLENGLADHEYRLLEEYERKVSRMDFQTLCREAGVSHRSFVTFNLDIQDLRDAAVKAFIRGGAKVTT